MPRCVMVKEQCCSCRPCGTGRIRLDGQKGAAAAKNRLTRSQFGKKFVAALAALADALASEQPGTPPPTWVGESQYRMLEESALDAQILDVQQQIEKLQAQKRELEQNLNRAGSLRRLLYEQGEPLEDAVLEASG